MRSASTNLSNDYLRHDRLQTTGYVDEQELELQGEYTAGVVYMLYMIEKEPVPTTKVSVLSYSLALLVYGFLRVW